MFLFELYDRYLRMTPLPQSGTAKVICEKKRYERFVLHTLHDEMSDTDFIPHMFRSAFDDGTCGSLTELYILLANDKESFKRGVYHYDSESHGLREIPVSDHLQREFLAFYAKENPNMYAVCIITGLPHRGLPVYGEHTYPRMCIDVGRVEGRLIGATRGYPQNVLKPLESISLSHIATLLDIDPEHECPMSMLIMST